MQICSNTHQLTTDLSTVFSACFSSPLDFHIVYNFCVKSSTMSRIILHSFYQVSSHHRTEQKKTTYMVMKKFVDVVMYISCLIMDTAQCTRVIAESRNVSNSGIRRDGHREQDLLMYLQKGCIMVSGVGSSQIVAASRQL